MCAAGQRHVHTVVDHDSRPGAAHDHQKICTETRQVAGLEVSFPNLQHINAGFDRVACLRDQALASPLPRQFSGQAPAIGYEMQNQNKPSSVGSIAEAWLGAALEEDWRELGETRKEVDEAQAADGAADEIVTQDRSESGPRVREIVFFPRV